MHLKTILFLAWSLTSGVIASDNPQAQRCNLSQIEQNHLAVDQMPPACNLPACLGLTGTITCIISAVTSGDAAALQRCISDGLTEICSCAACIPSLMNFLLSLGVCVTPPKNTTEVTGSACPGFVASPATPGNRTGTLDGTPKTSNP